MAQSDKTHFMTDAEWDGWLGARGEIAAKAAASETIIAKSPRKPQKPTPARLAADLLRSAAEGDVANVIALIEQGASPNTRERAAPRQSVVEVAMAAGRAEAALALVRAGGWCAPDSYRTVETQAFDQQAATRRFSGETLALAILNTISVFFKYSSSWAHLMEAAEICRAARPGATPSTTDLLARAAGEGRWDMVHDALQLGESLDDACWSQALAVLHNPYRRASPEHVSRLAAAVAHKKFLECMPRDAAQALFSVAVDVGSASLLEALLNARLRPSPDWMIKRPTTFFDKHQKMPGGESSCPDMQAISLVMACALNSNAQDLFNVAASCPAALAAARSRKASPWRLLPLSIGRLQELDDLGIPLDGLDVEGNGLFHVWALVDHSPRSGWPTLGRKLPELFSLRNSKGATGSESMASKLSAEGARDFFATLARMEARDIRQASGPAPTKKTAPKPRQRL